MDVDEFDDIHKQQEFSVGRDGRTRWYSMKPLSRKSKIQSVHYPGVQSVAANLTSAYDCWNLFFNDEMLEAMVVYTNNFIDVSQEELGKTDDSNCTKHTNLAEVKAFIGLLYLCGIYKSNNMNTSDLWKKDGTGVELFSLTMHYNRFCFLLQTLHFDDIRSRQERKDSDKLAPVRDLLDIFIDNCQKVYCVSDLLFIKEMYEPFRGKCSFKQYLPHSKSHYGIRMHTAVDAVMFYTFNIEIDVPNQVEGVYKLDSGFNSLAVKLAEPVLNDGRCVIVEKPCTLKLAKKLLTKKTYLIGKLSKHESEIPEHFLETQRKLMQVGYTEDATLVSSIKKNHRTILLSTRPDEVAEDLVQFVSVVNRMVKCVSETDACIRYINRSDNRWAMIVFYSLLNIASKNSLIISRCNGNDIESRKDYVRELAMSLCHEHLVTSLSSQIVPFIVKTRISKITKVDIPVQCLQINVDNSGGVAYRCQECPSKRKKKTKSVCKDCKKCLCLDHLVKICTSCYEEQ